MTSALAYSIQACAASVALALSIGGGERFRRELQGVAPDVAWPRLDVSAKAVAASGAVKTAHLWALQNRTLERSAIEVPPPNSGALRVAPRKRRHERAKRDRTRFNPCPTAAWLERSACGARDRPPPRNDPPLRPASRSLADKGATARCTGRNRDRCAHRLAGRTADHGHRPGGKAAHHRDRSAHRPGVRTAHYSDRGAHRLCGAERRSKCGACGATFSQQLQRTRRLHRSRAG